MAFLNKTGLQALTNKLVQGDAIKVASSKGTTIKEVIDNIQRECESVALPNNMTLENRVNEFKIGKGRDIDVSEDVEQGKVGIQLQGRTYQNLTYSNKYLFSTNKLEYFTVERDKEKNHIRVIANEDITSGYMYFNCGSVSKTLIKPNTTYTAIIKKNPTVTNMRFMISDGNALNISAAFSNFDSLGRCKFITNDMVDSQKNIMYINNKYSIKKNNVFEIEDLIILEGDYTQTPIEELPQYFDSIKSSFEDKVVNINVQGKNLFDVAKLTSSKSNNVNIFYSGDKLLLNGAINNTWTSFSTSNTLSKGTYSLRIYDKGVYWGGKAKIWGYNSEGKLIANIGNGTIFTIEEDIFNIKLIIEGFTNGTIIDAEVTIQIEKALSFTPYEPYYNYNYIFDIKEPLRKLPNGVCDEIKNNNGKWELMRRVKKVTFNGSESWSFHSMSFGNKEGIRCILDINDFKPAIDYTNPLLFCDKLIIGNDSGSFLDRNYAANSIFHRNDLNRAALYIIIMMKDCNATADDTSSTKATKVKNWLKANPVTVYYELNTPIITPIDPIEFNISQGAIVNINSDIAPVSTYDAVLNRAGQIEQGVNLIADLRNRVNTLESIYDSNLLATQYKLDNLKLNYELEREED